MNSWISKAVNRSRKEFCENDRVLTHTCSPDIFINFMNKIAISMQGDDSFITRALCNIINKTFSIRKLSPANNIKFSHPTAKFKRSSSRKHPSMHKKKTLPTCTQKLRTTSLSAIRKHATTAINHFELPTIHHEYFPNDSSRAHTTSANCARTKIEARETPKRKSRPAGHCFAMLIRERRKKKNSNRRRENVL